MLAVLLAAVLALPQEPVKVTAVLSNDRPVVGEPTMLSITIETRDTIADRIIDPIMPAGLEVVETQDYTETRISFPGGRNTITERRLIVVARVAGQFTIPGAIVHAAGSVWTTRALPLTVLGGDASNGRKPIDSRIDVVLSPQRVYVGQQVLLEATAAFSRGLRSQQTRPATYQAPSPAGFWIHDVPEPLSVGMRTIDGELYETQTFRRVYFPLSPGTFHLPPARLQFELRRGFLSSAENYELVSDSPAIEVLPIPQDGRPASFRGAVGRYVVRASASPQIVNAGEAVSLTVEIDGAGNVKALPPPPLPDIPDIEVQPPTEDAESRLSGSNVGGIKRFTWILVPVRSGRLTIPPIEFAFFDPDAARFEVARTAPVMLDVRGSARPSSAEPGLAPLARTPSRNTASFVRSPAFLAAQIVPLLLLLWASTRRGRQTVRELPRSGRARPDRFAYLRDAGGADSPAFRALLDDAVRSSIADALGDPSLARASTTALATALAHHGVPATTTSTIIELLADGERIRFAGGTPAHAGRKACVDRAERAVRAIEHGQSGTALRAVLLALLVAVSPGTAQAGAAQSGEGPFHEGVTAWDRGDFITAADAFDRYVASNREDANGWYDLGNARWASGDRGAAVHAWLRAIRREPRHTGARRNLETVLGEGAATVVPPRFALSPPQAALAVATLWWLAAVSIAILLIQHRRVLPAALGASLLFGVAAFATMLGRTGNDAAVALQETQLLTAPALKAEQIGDIPAGTILHVVERRDGWVRLRVAGTEGWAEDFAVGY
jgi:hypothetical protein